MAHTNPHDHENGHPYQGGTKYEESDVNTPFVVVSLAITGSIMVIAIIAVIALLGGFQANFDRQVQDDHATILTLEDESQLPTGVRLQANPERDLAELRADYEYQLTHYGWADEETGTVRIPIEEAIQLKLEEGYPTR